MDKSSFFTSLGGYLKANRAFFLSVLFILIATGGYFWWQAGFTFEIGRFFASCADGDCDGDGYLNPTVRGDDCNDDDPAITGDPSCRICDVPSDKQTCGDGDCDDDGHNNPSVGGDDCNDTDWCIEGGCPAASTSPSPSVTSSTGPVPDACTDKPTREGNGVKVCITNNTFGHDFDRETNYKGPGGAYTYTVHIINTSSSKVFGKTVQGVSLFYCPFATDGAIDDKSGPGCTTVGVSGICDNCTSGVAANTEGDVTFNFTPGEACGTYQLDSTWNPFNTFVIGKVINTGVNCPTPTPSTPATSPSTSPSTPPASPTTSPSTPPTSPSTSPSTPPASPSASPSASPTPLSCSIFTQQIGVGETANIIASGGTGSYAWYAPGSVDEGGGVGPYNQNPFFPAYSTPGYKTVTVVSGNDQAACTVTIVAPTTSPSTSPSTEVSPSTSPAVSPSTSPGLSPSPTFTFILPGLACAPISQSVRRGNAANFTATYQGSPASISWAAPNGDPSSGAGNAFSTEYDDTGTYSVTVRAGTMSTVCTVQVTSGGSSNFTHLECVGNTCARVSGEGANECSTVGASCSGGGGTTPRLALEKLVRNITQNSSEQSSVTASPTNTVEFSLKVSSNGSGTVNNVTIRDSLPAGLTYVPGSTKIDGIAAADGIVSSGLSLGNMPSGRTITVRFRATVASASFFSAGTTVLSNIAYARASNAPEVADVAFVSVLQIPANTTLSLSKTGRNVTRGETAEASLVRTSAAQTIEFVLRARNTSAKTLENVMIRDVLPPAITLVPGSVRIGTASASNSLTAAGLSLGSLTSGQEVVVRFSGLVASSGQLPAGTTTVINTATVSATGQSVITAQMPIVISSGLIVPPVATGPGETTVLALIISAIITLLYVGYTSTETYRRHEAGAIAQESHGDTSDFK